MSRFSALVFLSLCAVAISGVVSSYPDPEQPGGLFRRVAAYDASQFDGQTAVLFAPVNDSSLAATVALSLARVGSDVRVYTVGESSICNAVPADEAVKATGGKCSVTTLALDDYDAVSNALATFKTPIYTIVNFPGLDVATILAAESAYVAACGNCRKIAHPSIVQLYNVESNPEIADAADTAATVALMKNAVGHGVRANSMRVMNMDDETEASQVAESTLYLSSNEANHVRGTMFNRHWSFY